jgi:hypothetical protein
MTTLYYASNSVAQENALGSELDKVLPRYPIASSDVTQPMWVSQLAEACAGDFAGRYPGANNDEQWPRVFRVYLSEDGPLHIKLHVFRTVEVKYRAKPIGIKD